MNSGKIVADGTGRVDGTGRTEIEGSTIGPCGPKKIPEKLSVVSVKGGRGVAPISAKGFLAK